LRCSYGALRPPGPGPPKTPKSCALASLLAGGGRDRLPGVITFRFVVRGPSSHLPGIMPFRFAARGHLDHHLPGAISLRFVARGPQTNSWGPFPSFFQVEGPRRGPPKTIKSCQLPIYFQDCTCQSFGRSFRKRRFLTSPSTPPTPGALPGTREHTQIHALAVEQVTHLPVCGPAPSKTSLSRPPPSCLRPPGAFPGGRGHTHSCTNFISFCNSRGAFPFVLW
jgi:hypothetical protein